MSTPTAAKSMDEIVALCKRRGFVFPASEIYGGINGFWDYGPLGVELKNNLRDAWWHDMVRCPPTGPDPGAPRLEIVGLDSAIIQNPKVWEASGHVAGFNDPMVDCRTCKSRFRADHLWVVIWSDFARLRADVEQQRPAFNVEEMAPLVELANSKEQPTDEQLQLLRQWQDIGAYTTRRAFAPYVKIVVATEKQEALEGAALTKHEARAIRDPRIIWYSPIADYEGQWGAIKCPNCGEENSFTEARQFNLMFPTSVGAVQDENSKAYLRPETAQGLFLNYKNILDTMRVKVPFGIAQIGKAFRNEVNPRNFIYRSREFEQMEMEWFCQPEEAPKWFEFWQQQRLSWWKSLGLSDDNLTIRQHDEAELSHYAQGGAGTVDIEYRFPFTHPGFAELEGIAHRTDFDLKAHQEHAKVRLEYFDQERNERYIPHVVEPAAGLTRGVLALICEAYTPDPDRPSKVFLKFHPRLAPIQAAVFPLVAKNDMPQQADNLYQQLRKKYATQFDIKQSIGKRYARMDESGTPYCFTIDGQTLADQTVTVRDRDDCSQQRIGIARVAGFLADRMGE
ncbi:MAG: glycine--tRNA ligase [Planctomycetota bacterium]|nr:glycine--tRNA ligase [Planctomycetota bacterium]